MSGEADKIDPATIAALYVQHAEELRRFLLGVLRDPQLVNDVLQATFAKALEVGHTTREETRKGWLFRVAYHEALAVRRRDSTGDRVLRNLAWTRDLEASEAEEPLLRFESVEGVRRAIDRLPPEQSQVVRMRIYEEKTFAVIAAELNIPLGTALARMRAAVSKLRQALEEPL